MDRLDPVCDDVRMFVAADHPAPHGGDRTTARIEEALGRLGSAPVSFVDPPADLWDRIEAALGTEPVGQALGVGSVVEYRIDANDVLVDTGDGWNEFAEANEAPELVGGTTGRSLWDHVAEGPVRDLWRAAVVGVRESGRVATVPFRCDGPATRRWYEMSLTPAPDGSVGFRSLLVFEMDRPEVLELRRAGSSGEGAAIEVCCWCAAARDGATWRVIEEVLATSRALEGASATIVHGFCERCAKVARADLLAQR